MKITREQLVSFVESAFSEINMEQKSKRTIADSFLQCGLDPFFPNQDAFTKHLDNLSEDGVYKALTDAHTAEVLGKKESKANDMNAFFLV